MSKILGTALLILSCLSTFGQAIEKTELSLHINKFDFPCIELGTQSVVA
jgi:hypothetical protein